MLIPLLVWAQKNGLTRDMAYQRHRTGDLPVQVHRTSTGRLMVELPADECAGACIADVHAQCLTDAVLAELARRGILLDPNTTTGDTESTTATSGSP